MGDDEKGLGLCFDPVAEYARMMGQEALRRQQEASQARNACCRTLKENGHASLCKRGLRERPPKKER